MRKFKGAPSQKAGESNVDYMRRLSGIANQRMRELETLSKKKGFKNIKKWAYANARDDIKRLWQKTKKPWRFGTAVKKKDGKVDERHLQAEINALKRFLDSPTSTKTGILQVYNKRAETINNKFGTDLSWEDIGKFWGSEAARRLNEKYDSDTIMNVLSELEDMSPDDIRKAGDKDFRISEDDVLNDTVKQTLEEFDLSEVSFLFSGKNKDIKAALEEVRG